MTSWTHAVAFSLVVAASAVGAMHLGPVPQDPGKVVTPQQVRDLRAEVTALRQALGANHVEDEQRGEAINRLDVRSTETASRLGTFDTLPVGTILPFVGDVADLAGTDWVECSAANAKKYAGVPDLTDRFLQGTGMQEVGATGGRADIPTGGSHNHGGNTGTLGPYDKGQINYPRGHGHLDDFSHRHSISTDGGHDHGGENRPPYHTVRYIVKVRKP